MNASWWAPLLLGGDSFVVAAAISPLVKTSRMRWRLAALFGICDGLASLAGAAVPAPHLELGGVGPIMAIVYGVYCLCAAHWSRLREYPFLIWLLPVIFSLDNFASAVAGAGAASESVPLAVSSAALAALGLCLGSLVRPGTERARHLVTGAGLLAAGTFLFLV